MPEGVGRIGPYLRKRFPRSASLYDRYHVTITVVSLLLSIGVVGWIGVRANDAGNNASHAVHEITKIKQASPCTASQENPDDAAKQKECHESIGKGLSLVTSLQACEFIQRGSTLLIVNGQRIHNIECRTRSGRTPQPPNGPGSSEGENSSSSTSGSQEGAHRHSESGGSESGGGAADGAGNGGHGGSNPSNPGSGGGGNGGGGGASNPQNPSSPQGESRSPSPSQPSPSGPDESSSGQPSLVEGAKEGANEVAEIVCHIDPLGVEVCVHLK